MLPEDERVFFQSGGTLPLEAGSYVVRAADRDLVEALSSHQYCYLLNSRQIGKSSLCVRAMQELAARGVNVAFLDLTKFGGRNVTAEQWYLGMLREIGRAVALGPQVVEYWKRESELGPMQRFFGALREVVLISPEAPPLCIIIDEIDATRSLPFSTDEFFAGIRECFNRRVQDPGLNQLTFCLVGVATPTDLIRDPTTTPFNIGKRIELRDFTDEEALPLAAGLGPIGNKKLKRVLYWTGGHPYLTQAVCAEAAAHSEESIDRIVERMFFHAKARETNVNLADVQNRLLGVIPDNVSAEEHRASVLDCYRQLRARRGIIKDDESDPVVALLKLCGLVRAVGSYLWVRNRIYYRVFDRDWIAANLPDREAKRQRRAAQRAAWRAGLVCGLVGTVIGLLAIFANGQAAQRVEAQARLKAQQSDFDLRDAQLNLKSSKNDALHANREKALAQASAKQYLDQKNQYLAQKKVAESEAALAAKQTTIALLNAQKYLDQKQIAETKTHEANASRDIARHSAYVTGISAATYEADASNWVALQSVLQEKQVSSYSQKGWEYDYWKRFLARGLPLNGAKAAVVDCEFSPNGDRVVTASWDGTARIYDSRSGKHLGTFRESAQHLNNATFSPDGRRILVAGDDGKPVVFDAITRAICCKLTGHTGSVQLAIFSPNGKKIATASADGTARIWDALTGHQLREIKSLDGAVTCVTFSPDSERVATGSDTKAQVWDAFTGAKVGEPISHGKIIQMVAFSPDGRYLAASSSDSTGSIADYVSGAVVRLIGHTGDLTTIAFSPNGNRVLTASFDGTAQTWDAKSGTRLRTLSGHSGSVWSAVFSPDGARIVTASADGSARIWDAYSGRVLDTLAAHSRWVPAAAFSPDGTQVATASLDGTAKLWNVMASNLRVGLFDHYMSQSDLEVSKDGKSMITADGDRVARVWDISRAKEKIDLSTKALPQGISIQRACMSPSGDRAAVGRDDGVVNVWNLSTKSVTQTIPGYGQPIVSIQFANDGSRLLIAAANGCVRVVDSYTKASILELPKSQSQVYEATFSPDGTSIAIGEANNAARVYATNSSHKSLLLSHPGSVYCIAYSTDGRYIATGCSDTLGRIWDAKTGHLLKILHGHLDQIDSVQFSPTDDRIISGSMDGSIRLWDVPTGECVCSVRPGAPVLRALFSPTNGRDIIATCADGLSIWPSTLKQASRIEPRYVAAELIHSSKRGDYFSWNWQANHWLTPQMIRTEEVQGALAFLVSSGSDKTIIYEAKKLLASSAPYRVKP